MNAVAVPHLSHFPVAAATIDQSGWTARKGRVALPNGVSLAYVEAGDPAGPPLLLLHGWTDTSRSWTTLLPALLEHRLLIPDLRGHGASDKPAAGYTLRDFAADARLFLDASGIARAAVAGHSLGSMVGQVLAADHPKRVAKLVLIGSTALAPATRGDYLCTSVAGLADPIDPDCEFMREWNPANGAVPIDPGFAAAAMTEILATPLHVWRGVVDALVDRPLRPISERVKAPSLILSGGEDPIFPPDHHAALAEAIPHAEAIIYGGLGHNLLWERPREIAEAMVMFLSKTD